MSQSPGQQIFHLGVLLNTHLLGQGVLKIRMVGWEQVKLQDTEVQPSPLPPELTDLYPAPLLSAGLLQA